MASSFQHYFSRISNFNYHQQHPAASLQLMDDTRSFCTAFLPPLSPVDKGMLPLLLPLLSNSSIAYHYWERWKDEQDLLVIENADTTMGGGKDWLHSTVSCRRRCHMFISVFLSQRNGSDAIEESTQERTHAIESTQERTYAAIDVKGGTLCDCCGRPSPSCRYVLCRKRKRRDQLYHCHSILLSQLFIVQVVGWIRKHEGRMDNDRRWRCSQRRRPKWKSTQPSCPALV
jgi:hypothetical protein